MNLTHPFQSELEEIFRMYQSKPGFVGEVARRGYSASTPSIDVTKELDVLMIGINPSFDVKNQPVIVEGRNGFTFDAVECAKNGHRYYKPFGNLVNQIGEECNWGHIDLFQFQNTTQKDIEQILKDPTGVEFLIEQLQITMKMLERLRPKLIGVCNSGAAEFMGINKCENKEGKMHRIWMGYKYGFDESFCIDVINGIHPESVGDGVSETPIIGIPVIFSSTLTYMPWPERRRLAHLIKRILNSEQYARTR